MPNSERIKILRWVARISGIIVAVFWGAFFIEHLEWLKDFPELPPFHVLILMLAHLFLITGYLIALKYEVSGAVISIISAVVFFRFTAGDNFILFSALTSIPGVLYLVNGFICHSGKINTIDNSTL
jgi:hypothetical protein